MTALLSGKETIEEGEFGPTPITDGGLKNTWLQLHAASIPPTQLEARSEICGLLMDRLHSGIAQ